MKCAEALEWISDYVDMPIDDPQREAIDRHLEGCEACAEQFAVWSASMDWMEDEVELGLDAEQASSSAASRVMDRIYEEQDWLMPVHRRSHALSLRSRQVIAGIIAFCMAMFLCALVFLLIRNEQSNIHAVSGILPTALAGSDHSGLDAFDIELPVASNVSEPTILRVVPTIPHYWIALSLFGVTFALLLLNWLTRVRQ
ncbi:anti-sigma factor family protein [Paenibacillus alvei]|uniref:anti-sigma factor family protein n=1 Tax=Paenibacillus alvei TaxID=44250 RepID=UPI002281CDB9|nr:zf-HC2 domain-containing protein [Paenibacillus alvei]